MIHLCDLSDSALPKDVPPGPGLRAKVSNYDSLDGTLQWTPDPPFDDHAFVDFARPWNGNTTVVGSEHSLNQIIPRQRSVKQRDGDSSLAALETLIGRH